MTEILVTLCFLFGVNGFPKYKKGDCVINRSTNSNVEFLTDNVIYRRILEVGKKNYLYEQQLGKTIPDDYHKIKDEYVISGFDVSTVKINCPKGF